MDSVIPVVHTQQAARELLACGADLTVDVLPHVGHELTTEIAGLVLERLRGYVQRHDCNAFP